MAVYENGQALPGTERKPSTDEKKARVREARRLWKKNAADRRSSIYGNRK